MAHITRSLTILVLAIAVLAVQGPSAPAAPATAPVSLDPVPAPVAETAPAFEAGPVVEPQQGIVFIGTATDEERELIRWAESRFTAAGLELPGFDVEFLPTFDDCGGYPGITSTGDERSHVTLCLERDPSSLVARRITLHELAHVWTEHTLSESDRADFVTLRGADAWRQGAWEDQGIEQAAEIITWALLEEHVPLVRFPADDFESLRTGFVALTGLEPEVRWADAGSEA